MPVVRAPLNYDNAGGPYYGVTMLLPNGKVLTWGNGTAWVLSPDAYGSYVTGSWRRVQDMPFTQQAGPALVLNNGKLLVTCGEYGTSYFSNTQLFDPETERWTAYPNTPVARHAFGLMFDDGSVYGNVSGPRYIPANSLPTQTASYQVLANLLLANDLLFEGGQLVEGVAALTPGGFFVTAETNLNKPNTVSHALGSVAKENATLLRYERRSALTRLGELPNWWRLPPNNLKARWTSIGVEDQQPSQLAAGAASVWYEPGAMCFMPKIGKVVLVDGVGSILTITPNLSPDLMLPTLTRAATMPLDPPSAANTFTTAYNFGVVDSSDRGKTAPQIASQGTLTVSTGLYTGVDSLVQLWNIKPNKNFYVRCASNTKFMRFSYDTATAVGTNTFRFNNVTTRTYSGASWDGTVTETGGEVTFYRPILTNMDQGVAILPNGNLLIAAGTGDGGFNTRGWVATWDGVQPVAQIVGESESGAFQLLPLPDGTVLHGGVYIYVPTTAERTPSPSAIPTITSAPSAIAAGGRFTLAGTQLTGIHQGGYFSEDYTPHTNIPIVRLTGSDQRVWFCSTRDYSYRGIEPGRASTCNVTVPFDVPAGTYGMEVVVNGCPSASRPITITPQAHGEATFINFIP